MIPNGETRNFENTFIIDNSTVDTDVDSLKSQIENAIQHAETIKHMKPEISWSSKKTVTEQIKNGENGEEIILCVAIKLKKQDGKEVNFNNKARLKIGDWNREVDNEHRTGLKEEDNEIQIQSPELTFHSTNIFTKKRELLDSMEKAEKSSKTKDIDDECPASETVINKDDDEDKSTTSDVSITDFNTADLEENNRASCFKENQNQLTSQDSLTHEDYKGMIYPSECNNEEKKKNNMILQNTTEIPKSAPNSPVKTFTQRGKLQRSQSSEQTNNIGLNCRDSSAHSRIRRVRSKHSGSLDRLWLPGRAESFNSRVSTRFCRKEEAEGSRNSQYYFLSPNKISKCHRSNSNF